jgi:phosphatidylserine/phosphatidylglycerophosphate/cardiolipin synthase-like enzyme
VAKSYLAYWNELKSKKGGPDAKSERLWMADNNPAPPDPWEDDLTMVFSPRTGLEVLDWYAKIAAGAKKALFMTFAFGMHQFFKSVYEQDDGVLRFALMEKEGNGAGLAQGRKDIARIRRLPNVVVALGKSIAVNSFDRWLAERDHLTSEANVKYVHTKFALIDPLGRNPVVITGSANFSAPSTNANNENMVVIRNDARVADIYFGEFMRVFTHYTFRESVARWQAQRGTKGEWQPNHLVPDDSWQDDYFKAGNQRFLRRLYFAGS